MNDLDLRETPQRRMNSAITLMGPMIKSYIRMLRKNYPKFPGRIYYLDPFELHFKVKMVDNETPDLLSATVMYKGEIKFWMSVPNTSSLLADGIIDNTTVSVYACEDGDWLDSLAERLPSLIQKMKLY